MRAIWTSHITFGLISIPVGVYSAVESSERVSFRLLHKKDHAPIKYKKFCSKEDIEVGNDEIVKGYEIAKGEFADVEDDELKEVQESVAGEDHNIDVLQFVDFSSLNPLSFETPYYLAPLKGGEKAYAVLRDALGDARRVGIARLALRSKPQLAALIPGEGALCLEILRSFEELRDPKELVIPASAKKSAEVKMAQLLIDQMSAEEWDPAAHPNEYRRALKRLLATKRTFSLKEPLEARQGDNVVDLMEALRKSLAKTKGRPKRSLARKAGAA